MLVKELETTRTSITAELAKVKSAIQSLEQQEQASRDIAEGLAKGGKQIGADIGRQIGKLLGELDIKVKSKRIELEVSLALHYAILWLTM